MQAPYGVRTFCHVDAWRVFAKPVRVPCAQQAVVKSRHDRVVAHVEQPLTTAVICAHEPGRVHGFATLPNYSSGAVRQDYAAFIAEVSVLGRVEIAPECLRKPGSTREPTPVVAGA